MPPLKIGADIQACYLSHASLGPVWFGLINGDAEELSGKLEHLLDFQGRR